MADRLVMTIGLPSHITSRSCDTRPPQLAMTASKL